jgi:hypothetical protein
MCASEDVLFTFEASNITPVDEFSVSEQVKQLLVSRKHILIGTQSGNLMWYSHTSKQLEITLDLKESISQLTSFDFKHYIVASEKGSLYAVRTHSHEGSKPSIERVRFRLFILNF